MLRIARAILVTSLALTACRQTHEASTTLGTDADPSAGLNVADHALYAEFREIPKDAYSLKLNEGELFISVLLVHSPAEQLVCKTDAVAILADGSIFPIASNSKGTAFGANKPFLKQALLASRPVPGSDPTLVQAVKLRLDCHDLGQAPRLDFSDPASVVWPITVDTPTHSVVDGTFQVFIIVVAKPETFDPAVEFVDSSGVSHEFQAAGTIRSSDGVYLDRLIFASATPVSPTAGRLTLTQDP